MSDVHERLVACFSALSGLPPETWPAEVSRRCAGESEGFRRDVLRMLAVHRELEAARAAPSTPRAASAGEGMPTHLGPYELRRELGRGGMGVVYLAYDPRMRREVALKVRRPLRPARDGPGGLAGGEPTLEDSGARFLLEARITGRLQHPGILPVYEYGVADGVEFFAMQPLRGDDERLRDVLQRRRGVPFTGRRDLVEVVAKVCAAVSYAHARGVVHGDLKPENVAVGRYGEVVLLDWGLAQVRAQDGMARPLDPTVPGTPVGTPGYVAPELVAAPASVATPASDVFSLGALLFEILTGALPAGTGPGAPLVALASSAWPPDAQRSDPTVPRELAAAASRALARSPGDRSGSPGELADEIRRWQEEDVRARAAHARMLDASAAVVRAEQTRGEVRARWIDESRALVRGLPVGAPESHALEDRLARVVALATEDASRAARRRVRRKLFLAVGAALAVAAVAMGGLLLDRRRIEADLDHKAALLAEVAQLSDARAVGELLREAGTLWPAEEGAVARLTSWLERAGAVAARRGRHEAARARLRASARHAIQASRLPRAEEDERQDLLADRDDLVTAIERWTGPAPPIHSLSYLTDRLARVRAQLERHEPVVADAWTFDQPEDAWRDAALGEILEGLDRITGRDGDKEGLAGRMRARLEVARDAAGPADEAWRRVISRMQRSAPYALRIPRPDPALSPLGPDPSSGLEEFSVRGTGTPPSRDAKGTLRRAEDFAIVLVLVPGGVSRQGSPDRHDPPGTAGLDALRGDEHPEREVRIASFYLSKYELTQGQWERLTEGERPSHERAGERGFTADHPVEMVTWSDARRWLTRYDLRLPHEAEWEHACRAGTVGERFVDADVDLARYANFADATLARERPEELECDTASNDGHHFHAAVGSFAANPFGLHDTYGNVSEWCQDLWDPIYYAYGRIVDPPGSTAIWENPERVHRGGSWADLPRYLRSADRRGLHQDRAGRTVGVRAARDVR